MNQRKKAFTLIELIIVVVIVGILALIAIPRYFANVAKAKRISAYKTLHLIRDTLLAYYAVNGAYPADNSFPITVIVDGDTVYNLSRSNSNYWQYNYYLTGSYANTINADLAGSGWQPDCYRVLISTGAEVDLTSSHPECTQ